MQNVIPQRHKIILFILIASILGAIYSFDKGIAVGFVMLFVLGFATLWGIRRAGIQSKELYALFLITLVVHAGAALFIYLADFQPFSGGTGDYLGYHKSAEQLSVQFRQFNFSLEAYGEDTYYALIIALLYTLTLPSMIVGQLFNVWLASLAIIFLYLISRELGASRGWALVVGLIGSAYPSFIFYTSLLLKDVAVTLLALVGLFITIKLLRLFSWRQFALFYVFLLLLTHFRFYIGFVLLFTFIVSWLVLSRASIKERFIYSLVMLPLLGFVPQVAGYGYYGITVVQRYLTPESISFYKEVAYNPEVRIEGAKRLQQLAEEEAKTGVVQEEVSPSVSEIPPSETGEEVVPSREEAPSVTEEEEAVVQEETSSKPEAEISPTDVGAASSFEAKLDFENPIGFTWNYFKSFMYVLLGPFPWQFKYPRHYFSLLETIPWLLLLFFVVRGAFYSFKKYRFAISLLIFAFGVFTVLAFFISNYGVIARIRIAAFLALLPFIAIYFSEKAEPNFLGKTLKLLKIS